VLAAQESIKSIYVAPALKEYIVRLVQQTRQHSDIYLGASPRASLTLYRAGQARAALHARDFVLPDDIKTIAPAVLAHRLLMSPSARLRNVQPEDVALAILGDIPVPESKSMQGTGR
jgi:MoxR-like ATPase